MMNSDYDKFKAALAELASRYLLAVESGDAADYFKWLSRYPVETVTRALARAPESYPTRMPTAGELIEICASVSADGGPETDAVTLLRGANDCEHKDEFEPEPEGGRVAGFDVCGKCGRAKPRLNAAAPPIELEYFRMARRPERES
jgi:hypothetical protein